MSHLHVRTMLTPSFPFVSPLEHKGRWVENQTSCGFHWLLIPTCSVGVCFAHNGIQSRTHPFLPHWWLASLEVTSLLQRDIYLTVVKLSTSQRWDSDFTASKITNYGIFKRGKAICVRPRNPASQCFCKTKQDKIKTQAINILRVAE